jgi:hypothetical protein
MSLFNKDIIQTLPDPQTYFEKLCEEEFGMNFTDHSIYEYEGNDLNIRLSKIWPKIRKSYSGKPMKLSKVGFGNMKVEYISMFDLPEDYWDDGSNYEFIVI